MPYDQEVGELVEPSDYFGREIGVKPDDGGARPVVIGWLSAPADDDSDRHDLQG